VYSVSYNVCDSEINRVFADSIASNPESALVNIYGVNLFGMSGEIRGNRAILSHVQAQQLARRRVKSARGGAK
jgi:hypothetical protein